MTNLDPDVLDYKHHNIIKTFISLPVQIMLKLYQLSVWGLMVWILSQFYEVFGDTVILFLFVNACLDLLLILIQSQRPVLKPIRSRDIPSVLCVLNALVNIKYIKPTLPTYRSSRNAQCTVHGSIPNNIKIDFLKYFFSHFRDF